jgi:S-formylglutathione hydrolase FrmB
MRRSPELRHHARGLKELAWAAALLIALLAYAALHLRVQTAPNMRQVAFHSHALGMRTMFDVLLPDGYASTTRRYPVLYLLHGSGGSYSDWVRNTDIAQYARSLPLIVVMPEGDDGWYADPVTTGPRWETFHIHELIPFVDSYFRTIANRSNRAIAGLSMGGFGAFSYAARHPDLFAAAASFSGALNIEQFHYATGTVRAFGARSVWPWRAHSPVALASNLRGLYLFLSSGNGQIGPLDPAGTPNSSPVEQSVHISLVTMVAALRVAGIPATVDDYGPGTHTWVYWQRELHRVIPLMLAAITKPAPVPTSWTFRTAESSASVWGYSMAIARPGTKGGFTNVVDRGSRAITVTGTGTVSLITAPSFVRGRTYTVSQNGHGHTALVADGLGRLHLTMRLGATTSTIRVSIGS